ncbi:MAG: cytochrome c [Rhodobacteraceae bacterium]|nr:cytochrome c [Paracoccaceae bacterium]
MRSFLMTSVTLALFGAPAMAEDPEKEFKLGVSTYKTFCSHCHGIDMVNPGTSSYDLRKWPTDNKAGFNEAVLNGRGDMPAWGDILLPNEVAALWRYVATRAGKEPFPEEAASAD